ncbi:MAG: hypothetical protein KBD32_01070 [Burkholderiales bacterium]|nr:hypothetical protein [Burkholderiales bacterium]
MTNSNSVKKILITLSTLALVACNGGGGGSSGGDTPSPTPSPTPTPVIAVQPLEITQNIIPSLNKVGSHQIWYMIVKNPNDADIKLLSRGKYYYHFDYDANTPINPTKYAMKYDNAISGVESDCLNIINKTNTLAAGKSCAYKFDAQWGGNIASETNFKFAMAYDFSITRDGSNQFYSESAICNTSNIGKCLPNNQNLQFNLMNLSHQANDLNGYTAMTNNLGGNIISMDGSTYWDNYSVANTANVYTINYNSSTNTYTKTLANTYMGPQFGGGFAAITTTGNNYYGDGYTQTGEMTTLNNMSNNWGWIYGLDGQIYGASPMDLTSAYLLNPNGINSTVTPLTTIGREATYGVNTNGSLWTFSNAGAGNMYCYDATNNYAKTTMNLNGAGFHAMMNRMVTANTYYLEMINNTDYFDINYNRQIDVNINYLIDIDNCQVNKSQYLSAQQNGSKYNVNQKFGVIQTNTDYNFYIESVNQFSNGLNGGN